MKDRQRTVHRLLAETFIPNPERKPEVAHNDGVKLNISLGNLRWATRKENSDDMQRHGSRVAGERHPTSILTEAQARMIQKLTRGKAPRARPYHRDLAAKYGVTRECISRIARGENWRHATA